MFSEDELKKQVIEHLTANPIPDGHKVALFIHTENDTVRTGVAVKTANGWNVDVQTSFAVKQENHNFSLGVNVVKTFG